MGRWSLCVHWQGDDLVHCAGGVRSRIQDEGYIKSRESKPESDHSIHVTGVKKCSSRKLVGEWWKEVWGGGLVHGSSPDLQGSRADETSFHLARWITSCILFCRNTFGSWEPSGKHRKAFANHGERPSSAMMRVFSSDTFGIQSFQFSMTISFKVTLTLGLHQLSPSHHGTMPSHGILTGKLQVRCPEEGCPPVETVITDLSVKAPKPGAGRCLWWVFVQPGVDHLAA